MDLRFSAEDEAFRDEVRTFLEDVAGVRLRRGPRPRRARRRRLPLRGAPGVGAPPRRPRLDLRRLAEGARRPRPVAAPAGRLLRGVRPGPGARAHRAHRRDAARPHADRLRHRRAARPLPARDRRRHRAVVPGLQRAGRGVRPRQHPDARRPRRRRVGDRRPEGVDQPGPLGRLVLRARPHRPGRPQAQGHLVPAGADAAGRRRDPPDPPAHRRLRVQRGVLHRGAHRRPTTSSATSTAAGAWPWARSPSSGARPRSART